MDNVQWFILCIGIVIMALIGSVASCESEKVAWEFVG